MPSTFAELATAEHLAAAIGGEGGKALLRGALEGRVPARLRGVGDDRFEQDACARRASGQALTPERIGEMWLARDEALFGRLARRSA